MADYTVPVLLTSNARGEVEGKIQGQGKSSTEPVIQSLNRGSDAAFNFFACDEEDASFPCLMIFNQSIETGRSAAQVEEGVSELLSRLASGHQSRATSETRHAGEVVPVIIGTPRFEYVTAVQQLVKEHKKTLHKPVIMLRSRHWLHDISLLQARIVALSQRTPGVEVLPVINLKYPVTRMLGKTRPKRETIDNLLGLEGKEQGWSLQQSGVTATDAEGNTLEQTTLVREFTFKSFEQAMDYMDRVAQGCEIADHHPTWTNSYKKLQISLSTWDAAIPHVTERDVMLAAYFDHVYSDYH